MAGSLGLSARLAAGGVFPTEPARGGGGCSSAGTGKATKGGKLLAKGGKGAAKAGTVKVTLKPTKAGKRLLKRKRSVKVKVQLVFKPTTGVSVKRTLSARLRR
jgi:hypothetical protein